MILRVSPRVGLSFLYKIEIEFAPHIFDCPAVGYVAAHEELDNELFG
jgi:hypothetical protein